jgi:hypothetical protein
MVDILLFALGLSQLLVALALVREFRRRRALERLLQMLLKRWRRFDIHQDLASSSHGGHPGTAGDARM